MADENWQKITLKSLIDETKDGEWGKEQPFTNSVKMSVIRGTDFEGVRQGTVENLPIRYIKHHIAKRKAIQADDILIETAGGTSTQSTGRTVFIRQQVIDRSSLPLICASFSRFIRINKKIADPNYIFWHLQYLHSTGYLHKYHTQHTGVARFQWTTFSEREPLWVPPLPLQQKIASILSAYDKLIENNTRRIAILEEMAQQIYKEWFVRMRFPGYQQVEFRKGMPVRWEIKKIANAFEILGGGTPSKKVEAYWKGGSINWFTPSDITSSKGIFLNSSSTQINELGYNKSSARKFPAYSVMMTSRATIGEVGVNTTEACTNQGFITCVPNDQVPYFYIYFWIRESKDYIESLASGATFGEITKSTFKKIDFMIPENQIMKKFSALMKPIFKEIEVLQNKNFNLRKTRDLLLPRLISGRITV